MFADEGISRRRPFKRLLGVTAAGLALPAVISCRKPVPETADGKPSLKITRVIHCEVGRVRETRVDR